MRSMYYVSAVQCTEDRIQKVKLSQTSTVQYCLNKISKLQKVAFIITKSQKYIKMPIKNSDFQGISVDTYLTNLPSTTINY